MTAPPPSDDAAGAIAARVRAECAFFDGLADLVDARYYTRAMATTAAPTAAADGAANSNGLPPPPPLQSGQAIRFLGKDARAAAKAELKRQGKAGKRQRLDPDAAQAQTTTQVQRSLLLKEQQTKALAGGNDSSNLNANGKRAAPEPASSLGGGLHFNVPSGPAPSRAQLLARLQSRIEAARGRRGDAGDEDGGGGAAKKQKRRQERRQQKQAKKQQEKHQQQEKKQKQDDDKAPQSPPPPSAGGTKKGKPAPPSPASPADRAREWRQRQLGASANGLMFSRLDVGGGSLDAAGGKGGGAGGKKPTKQQLLRQLEQQQKRDSAAAGSNGLAPAGAEDSEVAAAAWRAAMQRARGEKVLDDPKLLRRSLKREQKLRAKRAEAWREREEAAAEKRAERQRTRKEHLGQRVQAKQDRKKQKREQKLLRAGFEGRRATPIGGGGGGGASGGGRGGGGGGGGDGK